MSHRPDKSRPGDADKHALITAGRDEPFFIAPRRKMEIDHVRGIRNFHEGDAPLSEDLFETTGLFVILTEAVDTRPEGDEAGRSQDTGLTHAPSKTFAPLAGPPDKGLCAAEERADRGPQSFGKTDLDGVDERSVLRRVNAEDDGGVKKAGSIEMDA